MDPEDLTEGLGGDQNEVTGDTGEDRDEAMPGMQQLAGLPPMIGQDGLPLIIPIAKAKPAMDKTLRAHG